MAEEYFKWTEFYSEFATKLLDYRNNRTELIEKIKKVYDDIKLNLPTLEKDDDPRDIDPFTVFGMFNKGITYNNRRKIIRGIASEFSIKAEAPDWFDGIPRLNNLSATFYGFGGDRKKGDIDRLWNVFSAAITLAGEDTPEHRVAFSSAYDAVIPQYGVRWNITMGLYWIRPYFFVNLDSRSRWFLKQESSMPENFIEKVKPMLKNVPTASEYLEIRDLCMQVLESGRYPYRTLPELSLAAYDSSIEDDEEEAEAEEQQKKTKNTLGDADVNKVHYWVYAPGEGAAKWEEFYQKGIAALNYHELGNFSLYESREEMAQKFREELGGNSSFSQSTLACWQFVHEMKRGDIIFVKKGRFEILGRGEVESNCFYDEYEPSGYKNKRKVRWTDKGSWPISERMPIKTLTDITDYTSQRKEIEALFEREPGEEEPTPAPNIYLEYPAYSRTDFLREVYLSEDEYETLTGLLDRKKNVILQGPPGVGKTFAAKRLAYSIMGVKDADRVELVQFHQSYSYEDFVMGFRPAAGGGFEIKTGAFYDFCKKAADDSENKYFFIIDEINRGNLSKIFGELFMLIEGDKRGSGNKIRLLYSDELFYVPENLYLIGMMNTADRSLAMLDYALRRRFAFFDLKPAFASEGFRAYQNGLHNEKFNRLVQTVESLNRVITDDDSLGEGFCIGHSYFCSLTEQSLADRTLSDIVEYEIIPLLKEYWFDEPEKVQEWSSSLRSVLK